MFNKTLISLDKLFVGETPSSIFTERAICGDDDRISSSDGAIGRMVPVGCTAWIASNGLIVSAGHCHYYSSDFSEEIVEFNVPQSLDDGSIQHPGAEDQYIMGDNESHSFSPGYIGNDWLVFEVQNNDSTGLSPIDAQNTSLELDRTSTINSNEQFSITGFGVDGPAPYYGADLNNRNADNQTQQTDSGDFHSLSGTRLNYEVDTQAGNSGSPIIRNNNGKSLGIHTNGGCTSSGGYNSGTSLLNDDLWNTLNYNSIVLANRLESEQTNLGGYLSLDNTETTEFEYSSVSSFEETPLPVEIGPVYNATTFEPRLGDTDEYKHLKWDTPSEYLLETEHMFDPWEENLTAWFSTQDNISITSSQPVNIQLHDPWYAYQENGSWIQPDAFRPLSDQGDGSGNLQVFLEQNENFYDNIPVYRLKAPRIMATVDGLYEFTGWSGVNVSQLIEDDPNVLESPVVFHEGATVEAMYTQINNLPNYTATIPEDDELIIPTGSSLQFAAGFKFEVYGNLNIQESNLDALDADNPWQGIQINPGGSIEIQNTELNNCLTGLLIGNHTLEYVNNVHFSNMETGINLKTDYLANYDYFGTLNITNCQFDNISNTAIDWSPDIDNPIFNEGWDQQGLLNVENCSFNTIAGTGINIQGNTDWYYNGSLSVTNSSFINVTTAVSVIANIQHQYYWPAPDYQYWDDSWDPGLGLKNIISYNQFTNYTNAVITDGDILLFSHHNVYDGSYHSGSVAITTTVYELPEISDYCPLQRVRYFNDTIVKNDIGIFVNYGTDTSGRPNCYFLVAINNIFFQNDDNIEQVGGNDLSVHYYWNFMTGDPLFESEDDYHLTHESTALIDHGSVVDFNFDGINDLDPDGTVLDFGAFYYHQFPGDITQDGIVDVYDVLMSINHILTGYELSNNQFHNGDLNDSGAIDILDVVQLVSIIIDAPMNNGDNEGTIYVTKIVKQGGNPPYVMDVLMLTDVEVEGMQMQIDLDPGYKGVSVSPGDYTTNAGMTVPFSISEDSVVVKFLAYGMNGESYPIGSGKILEIGLIYEGLSRTQFDPALGFVSELMVTSNGLNYIESQSVEMPEFIRLVEDGMNQSTLIPNEYSLHAAHPNPFNPATVIGYDLPEAGLVQITIYDITGREVTNPVNAIEDAGYHQIRWDASSYSSGAYFVKMVSGDFTRTQKVMLVK